MGAVYVESYRIPGTSIFSNRILLPISILVSLYSFVLVLQIRRSAHPSSLSSSVHEILYSPASPGHSRIHRGIRRRRRVKRPSGVVSPFLSPSFFSRCSISSSPPHTAQGAVWQTSITYFPTFSKIHRIKRGHFVYLDRLQLKQRGHIVHRIRPPSIRRMLFLGNMQHRQQRRFLLPFGIALHQLPIFPASLH